MKFISIDPGTSTCGVALWLLDNKFNIVTLRGFTIHIDTTIPLDIRIQKLYEVLYNIYYDYQPLQVAHESAFINRFRPQAYGPIYTSIYMIRKAYTDLYGFNGLFAYPPKLVKAAVSKGTAKKIDMYDAYHSIPELKRFITNLEDEHTIDAILIGYTHLLNIRAMPEILLF